MSEKLELATFAGGCFWCIEAAFIDIPGVTKVTSGFTGGNYPNPTYEDLHTKDTGHTEAVLVEFNPKEVTYQELLEIFWLQIDPTDPGGQFTDRGEQYKTAIFFHTPNQKELAEKSKKKLQESGRFDKPIVTEIKPASIFYPAEEYHQAYAKKNPIRYQLYKVGSGRDAFIKRNN